ncbi:MAG: hypothetical protein KIT74_06685 [Fimbriimonadales bacterium]|nr:hypothetical protein [Fimbriimonadales bacterium]
MSHWRVSDDHPLREFFRGLVHGSLHVKMGLRDHDIEDYLAGLITEFMHAESSVLHVRNAAVEDLVEMVNESDVLLNADSFEQEREVHKHIGDYVLFWGGTFPEHLQLLRRQGKAAGMVDHVTLGRQSYHVVSTFVHGDHASEATLFRKLSDGFETYLFALHLVREAWEGESKEWSQGFQA